MGLSVIYIKAADKPLYLWKLMFIRENVLFFTILFPVVAVTTPVSLLLIITTRYNKSPHFITILFYAEMMGRLEVVS